MRKTILSSRIQTKNKTANLYYNNKLISKTSPGLIINISSINNMGGYLK